MAKLNAVVYQIHLDIEICMFKMDNILICIKHLALMIYVT